MASYVDFTLTFTDNSSGDRDELGTEVQIYSDSPSYKQTEPIDYAYARHGWMKLPLVGPGVVTLPIRLRAPVTFLTVRVRQFNAHGVGEWAAPGGGAGSRFEFVPAQAANTPQAPSAVGLVVAGTPTPPVEPPVDPPPNPPPSGESTPYAFTLQFSGVQGQSNWRYLDEDGVELVYDAVRQVWVGAQAYQSVWVNGIHPGTTKGTVVRFTAPENCTLVISGSVGLYATSESNGVSLTIKHNATTIYGPTDLPAGSAAVTLSESEVMTAGQYIDFIVKPISGNANCSTSFLPHITISTGGAAVAPVVANITPSSRSLSVGATASLQVNLSSAAIADSTITVSGSPGGIATIPGSIIIPIGQSSGAINVTADAAGVVTITATFNSSSAEAVVSCSLPVPGAQWPNEPAGMTLVTSAPFSDVIPSEWFNVYNTQTFASPGGSGVSFSPPRALDVYLPAGSNTGGGQWGINIPQSREFYCGFYWSTNADFIGYTNTTNKMIFFRNPANDNSFINWHGVPGAPKQIKWYFQSLYSNAHTAGWDGDADGRSGRLSCNVNGSAAVIAAGSGWHLIEFYGRTSTTGTSRDGIMKWWVDGVLCGNHPNVNWCPGGYTEMQLTPAWDGTPSGRDLTKSWHHYFDHIYISRKA